MSNQIDGECDNLWEVNRNGDVVDAARIGLSALMCGISEDCWCAGWLTSLSMDLWEFRQRGGGHHYGQGEVTERQAQLLRLLSEEAGGWFRWDDKEGVTFVGMDQWLACVAEASKPIGGGRDA